jgi:hypothetical protein
MHLMRRDVRHVDLCWHSGLYFIPPGRFWSLETRGEICPGSKNARLLGPRDRANERQLMLVTLSDKMHTLALRFMNGKRKPCIAELQLHYEWILCPSVAIASATDDRIKY